MSAFALPASPAPATARLRWKTNRVAQTSPLTGKVQIMDRPGGHWEADVELPPLTTAQVRAWFAALIRAQVEPVYFSPPHTAALLAGGNPGAPLVNGAGQTGTALVTDGWSASYPISDGDWISFNNGTFDELHLIKSGTGLSADALGNATLTLHPAIQISPADNAVIRTTSPRGQFVVLEDSVEFDGRIAQLHGLRFKLFGVGF